MCIRDRVGAVALAPPPGQDAQGGKLCALGGGGEGAPVSYTHLDVYKRQDLYIDAEEDTEALCISAGIFRQLMQENVYVRCYAYQMTAVSYTHLPALQAL